MHTITNVIRQRRSIFPNTYTTQPIPQSVLEEILENANWAPNHRHTEPWRFKVFQSLEARENLGNYLADCYKRRTPETDFKPKKHEKMRRKPVQAACVIAICMQRDPEERVPEWEEVAAVSCAVQNMWLTCTAHRIGAYWSSPSTITRRAAVELLGLAEGEQCWGLLYMGYHNLPDNLPAKRGEIADKTTWL
ncbi:MAG: nitroreductase [Bacteroidota bacterium]